MPPSAPPAARLESDPESSLVRGIGRWSMVALMINGIIGAGIFGLPSHIQALAGTAGLPAYLACAAVVLCIGLIFAEVSSRFTATGGSYLYTYVAFGPVAGFLVGWLMWIARVTALATVANVMASYLAFFWAPAGAGWPRAAAVSVVMIALTVVNLIGVRQVAAATNALTVGKLVPLLVFVGVGLFALDPHQFGGVRVPPGGSFPQAVFQLVFAFAGFEAAAIAAGEVQDPRRNIPFALLFAIAVTTMLYMLIQTVCVGTLPGLAASTRPLADASVRFMCPAGAAVIALGALLSTVGAQGLSLLAGPRLLLAMAERDQLPRVFMRIHPRFRTPDAAILASAAAGLILSITGTFAYLLTLNVVARLATYVFTAGALLVFRRRAQDRPALFGLPGGSGLAILGIAACVWLATQSGIRELRDVAIAIAAGVALHLAHRVGRRREQREERAGQSRAASPPS